MQAPTGPEAITRREVIQTIDRDIRFEKFLEKQARQQMLESGIPKDVVEFVTSYHANHRRKPLPSSNSPVVPRLTMDK